MNNSNLAEIANTADYSAMNYKTLLGLKIAFNWGLMNVSSYLEPKRLDEMTSVTHAYVTAMNAYHATRAEIMGCLEKEELREVPIFSDFKDDIDDQTSTVETDFDTASKVLALPAFNVHTDEAEGCVETTNSECSEKFVEETDITVSEDVETALNVDKTPVELAIEQAMALPIPDNIEPSAPYFVVFGFTKNLDGSFNHSTYAGRNMSMKSLEKFKAASERFVELFNRDSDRISSPSCVANDLGDTIIVRLYRFPEDGSDYVEEEFEATLLQVSEEDAKRIKKERDKACSLMRKAIKEMRKDDSLSENSETPYMCKGKCRRISESNVGSVNSGRINCDATTLREMQDVFKSYVEYYYGDAIVLSTRDGAIAVMHKDDIYMISPVLPSKVTDNTINNPSKNNKGTAVADDDKTSETNSIIMRAVDMTKSSNVSNMTNSTESYCVQMQFDINDAGEIECSSRPFSENFNTDALDKYKESHKKRAQTYNASYVSCEEDYTAYIYNDGKSLAVYYYMKKGALA